MVPATLDTLAKLRDNGSKDDVIKLQAALAIADRGGLPAVTELRIDAITMSFDARSRLQDAETIEGEVKVIPTDSTDTPPPVAEKPTAAPDDRLAALEERTAELRLLIPGVDTPPAKLPGD